MSQEPEHPHDPEQPSRAQEIVHEIKEEIEHAVEQVPPRVRWTIRKLVLIIGLSIVGFLLLVIVSALLYLGNRTQLVAKELTLILNNTLAQRSDVVLDIQDIRGNPFRRVRLMRPRVRFVDGEGPAVLEAPWIDVSYSAWNLLRGSSRNIDVVVEKPVIRIGKKADGSLRLPLWRSGPARVGRATPIQVRLVVHRGSLLAPGPLGGASDLELDARVGTGERTDVAIRTLRWSRGPYNTRDLQMVASVVASDSVVVTVENLQTPDLQLSGHARWRKDAKEKLGDVNVRRLRWGWLAEVTHNKAFDVPGEARGRIDARGDSVWRGRFTSELSWNDLPAESRGAFAATRQRIAVTALQLSSPAGNLDGFLDWSKQGWAVGGEVQSGNPELWKAIGIPGWPKGNVNGAFRYAVNTRRLPANASLEATLVPSELQGWKVDEGTVRVRFPAIGPDSFFVHAVRRGGSFDLTGASAEGGWRGVYTARDLPLEEWPDGRASGLKGTLSRSQGTVAGIDGELRVEGDLSGVQTDWLGMHTARWRLTEMSGRLLPTPDLTARADLQDLVYLGVHFDSSAIALQLGDENVVLPSIVASGGDTVVTAAGRASWGEQTWRVELDRAAVRSSQFEWTADPPVVLAGDQDGVDFQRLHARDGTATLDISGRWAVPGGHYAWRARAEHLDLGRLGLPLDWRLSGTSDVELQVDGVSGDPRFRFVAEASHPGWQGHVADSISLELTGRPHALTIEKGSLRLDEGTLNAQGRFEGTKEAWPDTLVAQGVEQWLSSATRWNGTVTAKDLPLDHLQSLAPAAREWAGQLTGSLEIQGSPSQPELDASRAADRAAAALAFELAAYFYRLILGLDVLSRDEARDVRARLGEALANDGRGQEAGGEFLAAAEGRLPGEALRFELRAAEQYLMGGSLDAGLDGDQAACSGASA